MLDKIAESAAKAAMKAAIKHALVSNVKGGVRGSAGDVPFIFEGSGTAKRDGMFRWADVLLLMTRDRLYVKAWRPLDPIKFDVVLDGLSVTRSKVKVLVFDVQTIKLRADGAEWTIGTPAADTIVEKIRTRA